MTSSAVLCLQQSEPSLTLINLLAGLDGADPQALDLAIHPDDAMLGFGTDLVRGVHEQALVEYFRSGHHAWRVVDRALRQVLGPRYPQRLPRKLLDFGAGHGRVTRFLLPDLGRERLVSTEADPSAVEFLSEYFGLPAFQTPSNPETDDFDLRREFHQPEGFDAVIALSVLTHLPEHTFVAWLRRWLDALTVEGGVLLLTTLGPSTLVHGHAMPAGGFHFARISESQVLDLDDYGTTWVTADWMGRTLDRLTGGLARWKHVPLGVWNLQDLWLVTLDPRVDWGVELDLALDQPTGNLELCHLSDDRRTLELSGWASGGRRPPRGARVELLLHGETVTTTETSGHRSDVAADFDLSPGVEVATGFRLRYESPEPLEQATQMRLDLVDASAGVVDRRRNGHRHVLHAGSIEATEMYLQLRHLHEIADHYRNQVKIFEFSRWGRMRNAWMALKSRWG